MYYFFILAVFIAIAIAIIAVGVYVGLIKKNKAISASWQDVAALLKRRYDLIPNFTRAVGRYANPDDNDVLDELSSLKDLAIKTTRSDERVEIEDQISQAIKIIFTIIDQEPDNYPSIENDKVLISLDNEFANIEENLILVTSNYNLLVNEFNSSIKTFPMNLVARKLNLKERIPFGDAQYTAKDFEDEEDEEDSGQFEQDY